MGSAQEALVLVCLQVAQWVRLSGSCQLSSHWGSPFQRSDCLGLGVAQPLVQRWVASQASLAVELLATMHTESGWRSTASCPELVFGQRTRSTGSSLGLVMSRT